MVWTQEEIDAFKARRTQTEGDLGKVDTFVNAAQEIYASPTTTRSPLTRKWKPTPTDENRRSDDWLGSPPITKRSWKAKSPVSTLVRPQVPEH